MVAGFHVSGMVAGFHVSGMVASMVRLCGCREPRSTSPYLELHVDES